MYETLDGFGHWMAGFIDGEGCFTIVRWPNEWYTCTFTLALRDDDTAILYTMHDALGGIGLMVSRGARGNSKPQIAWTISRPHETLALCTFLDIYPLRARKARDYAVWREAVYALKDMNLARQGDRDIMQRFKTQLATVRQYPT